MWKPGSLWYIPQRLSLCPNVPLLGRFGWCRCSMGWADRIGLLDGPPALAGVHAGGHGYSSYPVTTNAHNGSRKPGSNAPKAALCADGQWFQRACGHGNWEWVYKGCGKWSCAVCFERKLRLELVPEIDQALLLARSRRVTLKHMVLTWQGADLGAAPTSDGAERRRKDTAHLFQWFRRRGYTVDFLRVAETHKRGTVHFHFLVIMPGVDVGELRTQWKKYSRGAYRLWLESCYMKCPNCWDPAVPSRKQAKRKIVPWPWSGRCGECGYRLEHSGSLVNAIAWEAGKYLGKEGTTRGIVKKLTRSANWPKAESKVKGGVCLECDEEHSVRYVGPGHVLERTHAELGEVAGLAVAYYPVGGGGCNCFGESIEWRASIVEDSGTALQDMVSGAPPADCSLAGGWESWPALA